jgi:hypothetical protein
MPAGQDQPPTSYTAWLLATFQLSFPLLCFALSAITLTLLLVIMEFHLEHLECYLTFQFVLLLIVTDLLVITLAGLQKWHSFPRLLGKGLTF